MLAAAKLANRRVISGNAGEMVTAKTFHRTDSSTFQNFNESLKRIYSAKDTVNRAHRFQSWTTCRTSNGLSMKSPVRRVFVFLAALGTQSESCHRRSFAIVWSTANNREPRAAVRAIEEWILVSPIGWIGKL
jgi:hypothetical protein